MEREIRCSKQALLVVVVDPIRCFFLLAGSVDCSCVGMPTFFSCTYFSAANADWIVDGHLVSTLAIDTESSFNFIISVETTVESEYVNSY